MIDTTAAVPSGGLYTGSTAAAPPKASLDKQTFINLLVAQLRNQDPSSPLDTNEMMAQSTQLASMEQLTALTDTSRESFALQMRIAASGLVGRQVSVVDGDGVTRTGTASAVSFAGDVPMVTVGDLTVPLDKVSAVATPTQTTTPAA
jgi:flagellar basal-body rod modification protein FlgD